MSTRVDLGRVGVWSAGLRFGDRGAALEAASELEEFGFGAAWIPSGPGDTVLDDVGALLGATRRLAVATGIFNIWGHDPGDVAARHAALTAEHPGRFLLGLGVSHAGLVEGYRAPLATMAGWLDGLDAAVTPVPRDERALAALGPRMLELAATRTAGAHPYNVTPEHTARARGVLGDGALLAPEQAAALTADAGEARRIGREHLAIYLGLPNYTRNLLRLGFDEDDFADGGSDRLVDAMVAWGGADAVARRVREHHDAGADHVCVQVLDAGIAGLPRQAWRTLAGLLT